MLRREQDRIGAGLRTIESRQVALDASLDDWRVAHCPAFVSWTVVRRSARSPPGLYCAVNVPA